MVLNAQPRAAAFRGALTFLTRLPIRHDERDWEQFRERPVTIVLTGYVVGGLVLPALLLPVPAVSAALAFVVWVYVLTGINHLDGLADLGDALVVHGDADRRRQVMLDTTTGVGALLAVSIAVIGLALGGHEIASVGIGAIGIVLAAEVGAKLGMTAVICFGSAAFDGLGAELTERAGPRSFMWPALAAVPAALATWPHPAGGIAVVAGVAIAVPTLAWAGRHLGGVNGDVMGATNEVARIVALHLGVIAWMRF